MASPERIRLRVTGLAFGGDSVARAPDGRVVFFAGGAPGDEVEVGLVEVKPRFARGELVRVLEAGPARVAPRCPLVGRCGGCQWQEASLAAQRAAKQEIVERALGRLGAEVAPLVAPTEGFGYRTRARLSIGEGAPLTIGFQARRSHEVVDVEACPLLHPALERALVAARASLGAQIGAGGSLSGLVGRGDGVHLAVAGARDPRAARSRAEALVGVAGIVGVVVDGERVGEPEVDTADDGEAPFFAAADGFAQASHAGNRALRALVAEAARPVGARVLELYAGDGNFTRDLLRHAASVVAVEGERAACARLPRNAIPPAPSVTLTAIAEPAAAAARRLVDRGERFDVVVLDPPRAGAADLAPLLPSLADRVVYVSCDPMTLARDARALAERGLHPRRATPVDLMPQTFHVETVCLLERSPR